MACRSPHPDSNRGDDLEMRLPTAAVTGALDSFRSAREEQVPCPCDYLCSFAFADAVMTVSALIAAR